MGIKSPSSLVRELFRSFLSARFCAKLLHPVDRMGLFPFVFTLLRACPVTALAHSARSHYLSSLQLLIVWIASCFVSLAHAQGVCPFGQAAAINVTANGVDLTVECFDLFSSEPVGNGHQHQSRAPTTLNSLSSWDGASESFSWGTPAQNSYGQTITVPAGVSTLNSFTFVMRRKFGTQDNLFRVYVGSWNAGATLVDTVLYTGATRTYAASETAFTEYTESNISLSVTPGDVLLLFFSTSEVGDYGIGDQQTGAATVSPPQLGGFFLLNSGANSAEWTTQGWFDVTNVLPIELAVRVEFDELPPVLPTE